MVNLPEIFWVSTVIDIDIQQIDTYVFPCMDHLQKIH